MKGNPISGAGYLLRGFNLILQPGVRRYVVIPLGMNTLLFSLIIWYGAGRFDALIEWLLPAWLDWLEWLLWPVFAIAALLVVFYTFTLVANLLCAPFNGFLSEAVERSLTGRSPEGPGGLGAVASAFLSELRKLAYFIVRSVPLLVLFLIPGVNLFAPFLWIGFMAWMLAVEYSDYPMGNHGLVFPEQRLRLREKRMMILGFGGAALLLTVIPFLNFLAVPTGVAGATAMWVAEFSNNRGAQAHE